MFLGKLYPTPNGGAQQLIDAVFSSVEANNGNFEIHVRQMGIGELPYLIPGSIWVSKIRGGQHQIHLINPADFGDKEINKLNLFEVEKAPQIELQDFKNFKNSWRLFQSLRSYPRMPVFSLGIERNSKFRILIPPVELYRFTFAKSSRVISKIMHRTLEELARHEKSQNVDGNRVVSLRSALSKSNSLSSDEARAVAIALEPGGASEFSRCGWDAVRRSVDETGAPIKDGEFLTGRIHWESGGAFRSVGYPLKIGTDMIAFFVQGIIEATWRPSFDKVEVLEFESGKEPAGRDRERQLYPRKLRPDMGEEVESIKGPKSNRVPATVSIELPEAILGTAKIEVIRVIQSQGTYASGGKAAIGGEKPKASSTGDAVGEEEGVGSLNSNQSESEEFDSLREIKVLWGAALKIHEDLGYEVCSVLSSRPAAAVVRRGEATAQLCQFKHESGTSRHKWATTRYQGRTFVRRAICVQFKSGNRHSYAIEVERFSSNDNYCLFTFRMSDQSKIGPEALDKFLSILSNSKSRKLASELPANFGLVSIKLPHYEARQSVEGLAEAIGPYIFSNLDGLMADVRR